MQPNTTDCRPRRGQLWAMAAKHKFTRRITATNHAISSEVVTAITQCERQGRTHIHTPRTAVGTLKTPSINHPSRTLPTSPQLYCYCHKGIPSCLRLPCRTTAWAFYSQPDITWPDTTRKCGRWRHDELTNMVANNVPYIQPQIIECGSQCSRDCYSHREQRKAMSLPAIHHQYTSTLCLKKSSHLWTLCNFVKS